MKRNYRIKRDEYGYSIYNTSDGTRAEAGSPSLRREQQRLIVYEAFQLAFILAEKPQEPAAYKRLYDNTWTMAYYHGRKLANIPVIVADAVSNWRAGL